MNKYNQEMNNLLKYVQTEEQKVCEEIKAYFKAHKMSYETLSKALNTTPSSLSYYFSGKKFIPLHISKKLSELYGFDEYYLTHGPLEYRIDPKTLAEIQVSHTLFNDEESLIPDTDRLLEEAKAKTQELEDILQKINGKSSEAEAALSQAKRKMAATYMAVGTLKSYLKNKE